MDLCKRTYCVFCSRQCNFSSSWLWQRSWTVWTLVTNWTSQVWASRSSTPLLVRSSSLDWEWAFSGFWFWFTCGRSPSTLTRKEASGSTTPLLSVTGLASAVERKTIKFPRTFKSKLTVRPWSRHSTLPTRVCLWVNQLDCNSKNSCWLRKGIWSSSEGTSPTTDSLSPTCPKSTESSRLSTTCLSPCSRIKSSFFWATTELAKLPPSTCSLVSKRQLRAKQLASERTCCKLTRPVKT